MALPGVYASYRQRNRTSNIKSVQEFKIQSIEDDFQIGNTGYN